MVTSDAACICISKPPTQPTGRYVICMYVILEYLPGEQKCIIVYSGHLTGQKHFLWKTHLLCLSELLYLPTILNEREYSGYSEYR